MPPAIGSVPNQEIGASLEDFTLAGVHGGEHSLSALMSGQKGAIVVFWSGVCSHCVRYDAYLNGFRNRHPELALIAVASRHGETAAAIRKTGEDRRLQFPLLHDPDGCVARRWAVQQTPRAFLIDGNRTLLYRGAIDNFKYPGDPEHAPYLENAISEFLTGNRIRRAETPSFGCAIGSVYYILPRHL